MSSAARPAVNAASAWGTVSGRSDSSVPGDSTTGSIVPSSGTSSTAVRALPFVVHETVTPPVIAGAALSGCPSISVARSRTAWSSSASGSASSPRASSRPATTAAAEEPSPRPCGIRFVQCMRTPVCGAPA